MSVRQIKEGSVQHFIDDLNYNFSLTAQHESGVDIPAVETLLDDERPPDDWGTNYKSYYIKDTDTNELVPITDNTVPDYEPDKYYKYYPPGFIFIKIPSSPEV